MTGSGNFLSRWIGRRREARNSLSTQSRVLLLPKPEPNGDLASQATAGPDLDRAGLDRGGLDRANLDLKRRTLQTLPAIEAITATTDIRGFLKSDVPNTDLTRTALRRSWVSDPVVRDFIALAKSQPDFNDPEGLPMLHTLIPTQEVAAPIDQALGRINSVADSIRELASLRPAPEASIPTAEQITEEIAHAETGLTGAESDPGVIEFADNALAGIVRNDPAVASRHPLPPPHRPHGSALPR